MVESATAGAYYKGMKKLSPISLVDSLDLRYKPRRVQTRPGESVAEAWAATGTYLRKALSDYGTSTKRANAKR